MEREYEYTFSSWDQLIDDFTFTYPEMLAPEDIALLRDLVKELPDGISDWHEVKKAAVALIDTTQTRFKSDGENPMFGQEHTKFVVLRELFDFFCVMSGRSFEQNPMHAVSQWMCMQLCSRSSLVQSID